MRRILFRILALGALALPGIPASGADPISIAPARMPRIGSVDERFQSFNVEMVEVTGGRFWAPYKAITAAPPQLTAPGTMPGLNPAAFRQRPPIDLSNAKLRKLAAALGPAYMRVSGTWANSTYFQDSDEPAPATPPPGFGSVLTRQQWKGVVDFAHSVDAKLVTSFAVSQGTRDDSGRWMTKQAAAFLAYTKSIGGPIAAAEFFNEPTFASFGGLPRGYDAAAYARDFATFLPFARKAAPDMVILGPGSVGDANPLGEGILVPIKTEDMLTKTGRGVDAFSYHFYGAVSRRCGALGGGATRQSSPETALSEEWLSRTEGDADFYAKLRDRFEPGKPMWLTETGETACGGDPWASTFIDSFRYLSQMGRLAKKGVQVIMHNTLSASDYALIDEETLTPRPNYWSALLWRKLMGTTVLEAGTAEPNVYLYAHCLRGKAGGVSVLAINADRTGSHDLATAGPAERYSLTAADLLSGSVRLNGAELKLGPGDSLPALQGQPAASGKVSLAPASITFLAFPNAGNVSCKAP